MKFIFERRTQQQKNIGQKLSSGGKRFKPSKNASRNNQKGNKQKKKMVEQLAIIKGVNYGLRDVGVPCLSFDTHLSEGSAALQILFGKDIEKLLKDGRIINIGELEGHACWVERKGNMINFLRIAKI